MTQLDARPLQRGQACEVITIAVVGDYPVARWGLERLFAGHPQIRLAASVPSPDQLAGRADLDVVIIDLHLRADEPALAAIRSLSARHHVLVMSASGRQSDVVAARRAGADGYLTRDAGEQEITIAVAAVAAGGIYLSRSAASVLPVGLGRTAARHPALSPREEQVLSYIAHGFTHAQAARRLGIRPATVDSYIERIRRKLGIGNKADLTRTAMQLNLTTEGHSTSPRAV